MHSTNWKNYVTLVNTNYTEIPSLFRPKIDTQVSPAMGNIQTQSNFPAPFCFGVKTPRP